MLDERHTTCVGHVDDLDEVGQDERLEMRGGHDRRGPVRVVVSGDDRVRTRFDRATEECGLVIHHDPRETMHQVRVQDVVDQEFPDPPEVVRKLESVMREENDGLLAFEARDRLPERPQSVFLFRVWRRVSL